MRRCAASGVSIAILLTMDVEAFWTVSEPARRATGDAPTAFEQVVPGVTNQTLMLACGPE